ncbi:MAG: hypothetical protein IJC92_04485 [Bacteroidaceae bacterium]|nr:hypothetical protein [Bacteroidaceae bacterium]
MKSAYITILLLSLFMGQLNAQNTKAVIKENSSSLLSHKEVAVAADDSANYERLCKEGLEEKIRLEALYEQVDGRREALEDEIEGLDSEASNINASINRESNKLTTIKRRKDNSDVKELEEEQKRLLSKINAIKNDINRQKSNISSSNKKLTEMSRQKNELGKLKEETSASIIERNKDVLVTPFAQITMDRLYAAQGEYNSYKKNNKTIKEFAAKVERIIKYKNIYDDACKAANSLYKKESVNSILKQISTIDLATLTAVQRQEIEQVQSILANYDDGVMAFQELVKRVRKARGNAGENYTPKSFNEDYDLILSKNNLRERTEKFIKGTPYLNGVYNEYIAALQKDPKQTPESEEVILGIIVESTNQ